jgi:hypothetical protein
MASPPGLLTRSIAFFSVPCRPAQGQSTGHLNERLIKDSLVRPLLEREQRQEPAEWQMEPALRPSELAQEREEQERLAQERRAFRP